MGDVIHHDFRLEQNGESTWPLDMGIPEGTLASMWEALRNKDAHKLNACLRDVGARHEVVLATNAELLRMQRQAYDGSEWSRLMELERAGQMDMLK